MEFKVFDKVIVHDVGNNVFCDICDKDWTDSTISGGFLFGSYAYCPDCAEKGLARIKSHDEEWNIKATCPTDKSFADWIRDDVR